MNSIHFIIFKSVAIADRPDCFFSKERTDKQNKVDAAYDSGRLRLILFYCIFRIWPHKVGKTCMDPFKQIIINERGAIVTIAI